jgi:single-strand DNA-binding protein
MNNLNSVLLEGNLVRDPLIRSTPKGTQVCNFTIASNRFFRQDSSFEKETGFFDVETWGKLAEACGAKGQKGIGARIVGRLKQYRWENAAGENRSRIVIVAEHVEFRRNLVKAEDSPEAGAQGEITLEEAVLEQCPA